MTRLPVRARDNADDHRARVRVIDDFITAGDRRRMLSETARGQWFRSPVETQFGRVAGAERTSESLIILNYSAWAKDWLQGVEHKLAAILQVDPSRLEPWQIARYRRGGFYDYHLDCGRWGRHPSGERARTLIIVLEAPVRGGATHFRALAQSVLPIAGRLIAWKNLLDTGHCDHSMIHSSRPVWQGRKMILITWERERTYVNVESC
jgi:prolyl 4-hydroxylase